jgi:hypothetical protein
MIDKENQQETVVPDAGELLRKYNKKFVFKQLTSEEIEAIPKVDRELNKQDNNPYKLIPCAYESPESLVAPEPLPSKNELSFMWPNAIERIIEIAKQRDEFGANKYGTRLQPFNGRDPLVDAFQEGLDQLVYIEQELFERPYKNAVIEAAINFSMNLNEKNDEELSIKLFSAVKNLLEIQGQRPVEKE